VLKLTTSNKRYFESGEILCGYHTECSFKDRQVLSRVSVQKMIGSGFVLRAGLDADLSDDRVAGLLQGVWDDLRFLGGLAGADWGNFGLNEHRESGVWLERVELMGLRAMRTGTRWGLKMGTALLRVALASRCFWNRKAYDNLSYSEYFTIK
jgi:hypothetical protein